MGTFLTQAIQNFLVAFGMVVGACLLSGIGAVLTLQPPTLMMKSMAENIKFWALIAAVGGTIDPFRAIESHFIEGQLSPAFQQILFIISAFMGAHLGEKLIQWLCSGGGQS